MTKVNDDNAYAGLSVILSLILLFGVMPFLTMFVWNVLVVGLFGVMSVSYGGAWALMFVRSFFFRTYKKSEEKTNKEQVENTLKELALALMIAIGVLIIGYSNGFM